MLYIREIRCIQKGRLVSHKRHIVERLRLRQVEYFMTVVGPRIFNTLFLLHSPAPRPASPKLHRPTAIALA